MRIKKLLHFLSAVIASTLLILGISIWTDGMYLLGVPDIDEVEGITVFYPNAEAEPVVSSDPEDIELAVKLTGFLKYIPFQDARLPEEPMLLIDYHLNSGETLTVAANKEIVWWNGKTHVLKDDETFIKLAEGIFFFDALTTNFD